MICVLVKKLRQYFAGSWLVLLEAVDVLFAYPTGTFLTRRKRLVPREMHEYTDGLPRHTDRAITLRSSGQTTRAYRLR